MLVIRGNRRVADIYFGEFMRIFDHLYARYIVGKMKKLGIDDPDAGFLKEKAQDWVAATLRRRRKRCGGSNSWAISKLSSYATVCSCQDAKAPDPRRRGPIPPARGRRGPAQGLCRGGLREALDDKLPSA